MVILQFSIHFHCFVSWLHELLSSVMSHSGSNRVQLKRGYYSVKFLLTGMTVMQKINHFFFNAIA